MHQFAPCDSLITSVLIQKPRKTRGQDTKAGEEDDDDEDEDMLDDRLSASDAYIFPIVCTAVPFLSPANESSIDWIRGALGILLSHQVLWNRDHQLHPRLILHSCRDWKCMEGMGVLIHLKPGTDFHEVIGCYIALWHGHALESPL